MLKHIGLNINQKTDISLFYKNILGFSENGRFELKKELSKMLFNIDNKPEVFLLNKEHLVLELFLINERSKLLYGHLCIEVADRKAIAQKAREKGYFVNIIERKDKDDICFIRDRSGNIFELK